MFKIHFILPIMLFLTEITICQNPYYPQRPYEQHQFVSGSEPLWYETIFVQEQINEYCEGFNGLLTGFDSGLDHYIVDGDYIYSIFHSSNTFTLHGSYLEKRNVHTGQVEWKYLFNQDNTPLPEISKYMFLNDKGHLEIYGLRSMVPDVPNTPILGYFVFSGKNARFTYRKFDIQTGNLIEYFTPDNEDSIAMPLIQSIFPHGPQSKFFNTNNEDEILAITKIADDPNKPNLYVSIAKINKQGRAIMPIDTVILGLDIGDFLFKRKERTDEFVFLEKTADFKNLRLKTYNDSIKLIQNIFLEKPSGKLDFLQVHSCERDYFILKDLHFSDTSFFNDVWFYVYDYNGKLLKDMKLPLKHGYHPRIKYFPELDKFIVVSKRYEPFLGIDERVEILYWEGKDELVPIHIWGFEDKLRNLLVNDMFWLEGNKLLLCNQESSFYYDIKKDSTLRIDDSAKANSYMLFDAEEINLITKTIEVEEPLSDHDIQIIPNPAVAEILINSSKVKIQSIKIIDVFGEVKFNQEVLHGNNIKIDVSNFTSGSYFIMILDEKSKPHIKKMIKT